MSVVDRVVRAGLLISGARVVFDFSLESIAFDFFHRRPVCSSAAVAPLGEPSAQDSGDVPFCFAIAPGDIPSRESEGNGLLVLAEEVRRHG